MSISSFIVLVAVNTLVTSGGATYLPREEDAENSTAPEMFDDGIGAAANRSILELYRFLRNTENPSAKEVEAIKRSDTIRSYAGHIIDGHFYTVNSHKWRVVFPTFAEFEEELLLAELHVDVGETSEHLVGLDTDYMLSLRCDSATPIAECRRRMLSRAFNTTRYVYDEESGDAIVIDFTEELRNWLTPDGTVKRVAELWSFKGTEGDLVGAADNATRDLEAVDGEHRRQMLKILSDRAFQEASEEEGEPKGLMNVNLVVYTRGISQNSIVKDRLNVMNRTYAEADSDMDAEISHDEMEASDRVRRSASDEEEHARMERRKKKKEKQLRKERREEYMRAREEKLARQHQEEESSAETSDAAEVEDFGPCRVVEMQVNFEEIGWSQWILFPKSFNAGVCSGRCAGPLERIHNPSNHAVMQDLIRLKQPGRAPEPCCIPTRLQPLSMLYVEDGAIVVRHHEDMLAEECGCR